MIPPSKPYTTVTKLVPIVTERIQYRPGALGYIIPRKIVKVIIDMFIEVIVEHLAGDIAVYSERLGRFHKKKYKRLYSRNPRTHKLQRSPDPTYGISFKLSRPFYKLLNPLYRRS